MRNVATGYRLMLCRSFGFFKGTPKGKVTCYAHERVNTNELFRMIITYLTSLVKPFQSGHFTEISDSMKASINGGQRADPCYLTNQHAEITLKSRVR